MKQKSVTDELCDNIETTDRQMNQITFHETLTVRGEIDESRREFLREKAKHEEVLRKKQEINEKIELFKLKFHQQRKQTKTHQEMQARIEKYIKQVVLFIPFSTYIAN